MQEPFVGLSWRWQSAQLRRVSYRNALTIGANAAGLYLRPVFLFRLRQPPLLVPWSEITVLQRKRSFFGNTVRLQLTQELQVPLLIRAKLADNLKQIAGSQWPVEPLS